MYDPRKSTNPIVRFRRRSGNGAAAEAGRRASMATGAVGSALCSLREVTLMDDPAYDDPVLGRAHVHALGYLRSLPQRPVRAAEPLEALRARVAAPLGDDGEPAADVIDALAAIGEAGVVASAGPRYFGFVIGGSYPVALAADWLVSTWDQNPGIYATSPLSAVVEEAAARDVLEVLGLPRNAGVGFVTGCQMANFTALAAARHHVLARVGWDVEGEGLQGAPHVNVVTSAESHVTIHTALRYLGLGLNRVKTVETDAQGRMVAPALAATLAS